MLHKLSYVHVSDNVGKMYVLVMLTVVHNHIAMVLLTLLDVAGSISRTFPCELVAQVLEI